ncbi:MAG: protein NO VEIN domain-containing protein [Gloeotrichia echinulata DVL01]|jgi:hypothetical protein
MVDINAKRELFNLLAHHLEEFKNDTIAHQRLSVCALVECKDGNFRPANDVYFDKDSIRQILGNKYHIAVVNSQPNSQQLLEWLGVEKQPRPTHLLEEIKELVKQPNIEQNRHKILRIFDHLNKRWSRERHNLTSILQELKTMCWLPAKRDQYNLYSPNQLYTDENSRLFFTQAQFLDSSTETKTNDEFIEFLGIQIQPTTQQVVDHLLTCSHRNIGIRDEVYGFLQEHLNEIDVESVTQLREEKSIYVGQRQYVHPHQVFWNYTQFQPYRRCLTSRLRPFTALFTKLNVHEYPSSEDALYVLEEIGEKYTENNETLSEQDRNIVIKCWGILSKGLENKEIDELKIRGRLENKQVILTDKKEKNFLKIPREMFFKDRPDLADKFPTLQDNLLIKLKILNQYHAIKAAGVRPLSEVFNTELIDKHTLQLQDNKELYFLISHRKYLIKRVVIENRLIDNFINNLTIKECHKIRLNYTLELESYSEQQTDEVLTYLEKEDNKFILYYSLQNGSIPWAHISREIAYALDLDAETGQVASALKEVFSAESRQKASSILDALGFAPGTEAPPEDTQLETPTIDPKTENLDSSDIAKSPHIAHTEEVGTSPLELAIKIGEWAKQKVKIFYENKLKYILHDKNQGFDFICNKPESPTIKIQVKAITFNRHNIRFSTDQWTTMSENADSYELVIVSHQYPNINEIIRVTKAWNTLVYALSQLQEQHQSSTLYDTDNVEVLIGLQQNSNGNGNDVLLNWHRLVKLLPQENIIRYSSKDFGFEQIEVDIASVSRGAR